jgi:hypothetical protein
MMSLYHSFEGHIIFHERCFNEPLNKILVCHSSLNKVPFIGDGSTRDAHSFYTLYIYGSVSAHHFHFYFSLQLWSWELFTHMDLFVYLLLIAAWAIFQHTTIKIQRLQNSNTCSMLKAFEQEGIFIIIQRPRFLLLHAKDCTI